MIRDPREHFLIEGSDDDAALDETFLAGWAHRPPRGQMYGQRYAGAFREEIEETFVRGLKTNGLKYPPKIADFGPLDSENASFKTRKKKKLTSHVLVNYADWLRQRRLPLKTPNFPQIWGSTPITANSRCK
jgi:hypothetical protein